MKYLIWLTFSALLFSTNFLGAELQFPMRNDPNFATQIEKPSFEAERGPLIVVDKGHNNFFVTTGLITPLLDLLKSDGYRIDFSGDKVDLATLDRADIFLVITPISSPYNDFKNDFTDAYSRKELRVLEPSFQELSILCESRRQ